MSNKVNVIRYADIEWKMSRKIEGWFHSRLRGESDVERVIMIKASAGVKYYSWICESISEFIVLEGDLMVNDVILSTNDYATVEPFVEIFNETKGGMLAICTVHGKVIWARDIFQKLLDDSLSDEEADLILTEPWLSYLQNRIDKEIEGLYSKLVLTLQNKNLTVQMKKLVGLLISNK